MININNVRRTGLIIIASRVNMKLEMCETLFTNECIMFFCWLQY